MKQCVMIINPNSGKGIGLKSRDELENIIKKYEYIPTILVTEYRGHATKLVKGLSDDVDLVISVGGDGTFSEVMNGNLKREHRLVLSHLPVGTTNDIGYMYGLGNNLYNNLELILNGKVKDIDVGVINKHAFTYVASYGKFMDIPYQTPQELKKRLGYLAYIVEIVKRCFYKIPRYEVEFMMNGEKYFGKYTFIIISNANRIAGINNFYHDVKLDDSKFEVMLCSLNRKRDILKAIYMLKTSDIHKVSGVEIYKTNNLKIHFKEKNKMFWCVDGEKLNKQGLDFNIGLINNVKIKIPEKNIEKLFINK